MKPSIYNNPLEQLEIEKQTDQRLCEEKKATICESLKVPKESI